MAASDRWTANVHLGLHLEPGMKVGLYGGSFDPPHAGHRHVAETALKRFGLDRLVWLVSPQNPLKRESPAAAERRLQAVRDLARGPSMMVSDLERRLGTRFTIDSVRALKARYPGVDFIWVMGADSLQTLHRWKAWPDLVRELPIAVIARPGASLRARLSLAARRFAHARRPPSEARRLALAQPPAWTYLDAPWSFASSTALRSRRSDHLNSGSAATTC